MENKKTKILIWDLYINIKNSGGPAGYLYNWKEYLKTTKEYDNIYFLKDLLGLNNINQTLRFKYKTFFDFLFLIDIFKIWPCIKVIWTYLNFKRTKSVNLIEEIDLNEFDVIHFHVASHLYKVIPLLKNYNGKIVLTTHCPEPLSHEICSCIPSYYSLLKKWLIKKIEDIELESWEKADYMLFPVETAIEPYCVSEKLKSFLLNNKSKLLFCPTSILDSNIVYDRNLFKEKCNIPDNAFIITYVGRHTEVKGYDQLVKLGEQVLNKYKDVYFVIGGLYTPGQGLNHPRWIELGWINYGSQLIASSDLFILPNKETYFDIIALEVLRSGTPLMMSNTGGNKYFRSLKGNDGLRFFEYGDFTKQMNIIAEILNMTKEDRDKMRENNLSLFNLNFKMESFFQRYEALLKKVLSI